MKLFFVRHGEAVIENVKHGQPLTEKGKMDVLKTARILKADGIKIDTIWHSPKIRAVETAAILAKVLFPAEGMVQKESLSPNSQPEIILNEIKVMDKNIMIVSHIPFLQRLSSLFLFNTDINDVIKFAAAGVVCLENSGHDKWQIAFEITPDLFPDTVSHYK